MKTRRLLSLLLALALILSALPLAAAEDSAVFVRLKKDAALYADRELTELLGTLDGESVVTLLEEEEKALRVQFKTKPDVDQAWVFFEDAEILADFATPTDLLPIREPEPVIVAGPEAEKMPAEEPEAKAAVIATAPEPAAEQEPITEPKATAESEVAAEPVAVAEPKMAAEKTELAAESVVETEPVVEAEPEPAEPKPAEAPEEEEEEIPVHGSREETGPTDPEDLPDSARAPGSGEAYSASGALYTMGDDGTLVTTKYRETDEETGNLPAVRNQNPYGACWDFAIVGAMEIDLITDGNAKADEIDLSEFFVAYFSAHNAPYPKGGDEGDSVTAIVGSYYTGKTYNYNYLDIGGNTRMAYYILSALIGTTTEADNPFPERDRSDQDKTVESYDIAAQLTGAYYLPTKEDGGLDREAVQEAIRAHGSVKVSMWMPRNTDEDSYFQADNSAIFGTRGDTNHDVLLVGWDDGYSRENFDSRLRPEKNGAWKVRNSYGAAWGDGGYFWLSYEDASLSNPVAVDAESGSDISSYCYSYNKVPLPYTYQSADGAAAEVSQTFTVDAGEKLHAVGVETMEPGYTLSAAVKVNGEVVAASSSVKAAYKGFHQLKLSPAWAVNSETKVEVVVTYTADEGTAKIPYQYAGASKSSTSGAARTLDYSYTTEVAGGGFTLDGKEIYGDSTIRLYTKKNTDAGLLKSFTLNKTEVSLKTAEYADLSLASWSPSGASNLDVRWSSSDNAIAYMADDKDGRVVGGAKSGTAVVTAMSSNGIFATCTVTNAAKTVGLTGLAIKGFPAAYTIDETTMPGAKLGDEIELKAELTPQYAPYDSLTWTSSSERVISISHTSGRGKTCVLKLNKNGTSTVKVAAPDGTSASVEFTVYLPVHVASVTLSEEEISLYEGSYHVLSATVLPENADNKNLIWSSSNPAVATVSEYGTVRGVKDGTCVITATAEENGKAASARVTVLTADPIEAFVYRMYRVCLQREPDEGGFEGWVTALKRGQGTGAWLAYSFLCSQEMTDRKLSDGDYVERVYEATMGRASDAGGKAAWVGYLEEGLSRKAVISGFVKSEEFRLLCENYGIERGDYTSDEPRDGNAGAAAYVARLYTKMLGRAFDAEGLNAWCAAILGAPTKDTLLAVALNGFMHSDEFTNKNLNDTDFVKVLYPTFLGRNADAAGLESWVAALAGGASRDDVAAGFAYSLEFATIMAQYGF